MEKLTVKISVIMGIFNCASTLSSAIESILNQTYENWELILCDDGSNDDTLNIAKTYAATDKRIIVIKNKENKGLSFTLNYCLKYAKGEYIARMDGDDICHPTRFEKQLNAFCKNPTMALVSSSMYYFDQNGQWGKSNPKEYPNNLDFIHGTPFAHAPCMIKHEVFKKVEGYSDTRWLVRVEDIHLWMKIYQVGYKGMNLQEPLYEMRDDCHSYARRRFKYRLNETYVKWLTYRNLNLPLRYYPYILRPILVGLLPKKVYDLLHKKRLKS